MHSSAHTADSHHHGAMMRMALLTAFITNANGGTPTAPSSSMIHILCSSYVVINNMICFIRTLCVSMNQGKSSFHSYILIWVLHGEWMYIGLSACGHLSLVERVV